MGKSYSHNGTLADVVKAGIPRHTDTMTKLASDKTYQSCGSVLVPPNVVQEFKVLTIRRLF